MGACALTIDNVVHRQIAGRPVNWLAWQDCDSPVVLLPAICLDTQKNVEVALAFSLAGWPNIWLTNFVQVIKRTTEPVWFDDWSEAGVSLQTALAMIQRGDLKAEKLHLISHPALTLTLFLRLLV